MKRVICAMLIALVCVGFAACSSKPNNTNPTISVPSSVVSLNESSSQSSSSQSSSSRSSSSRSSSSSRQKPYATVKEYLDTPKVQSQINSTIESNETDDMQISAYAEGDDTLVYDYTFTKTYDENDVAKLKSGLDKALEEKASDFTSVVTTLKTYVDVENPKVKVVYRNGDNAVITERTFE